MSFDGSFREVEAFSDLRIGEMLFAAEFVDELPLGGHLVDCFRDDPFDSFGIAAVRHVIASILPFKFGDSVFQSGLFAAEVVAGLVAGNGEEEGVERSDFGEGTAAAPKFEKDVLGKIFGDAVAVENGADESEHLPVIAAEYLFEGVFLAL